MSETITGFFIILVVGILVEAGIISHALSDIAKSVRQAAEAAETLATKSTREGRN